MFFTFVLLTVAMLLVGARRLRHVSFLHREPLVVRLAGLSRLPYERTLSRQLKKLTSKTWPELDRLSSFFVGQSIEQHQLPTLTLDMDGSVISTGMAVGYASRGYNPHRRKNPSYYPLSICLDAQSTRNWDRRKYCVICS